MNMKYKQLWNACALSCMPHRVQIPDFRLCIGDAERLESIPVLLFTDFSTGQGKPTTEKPYQVPIERIGQTGDGNVISQDDFTTDEFFDGLQSMGVK